MSYMLSESRVPQALTSNRLEWLKYVLKKYGVSDAGAGQFTRSQAVADPSDRRLLLDILNRVVVEESHRPSGFRGKG
jgi:hypothetical protein